MDNRIIPRGCDSIDSFAETYEEVRCPQHGQIVCTCYKVFAAST